MVKAHTPINWENEPSYNTPLNAANLNKMDSEIGILDDRIIEQDTIKLDKSTANTMVKAISFNENTGVFTITLLNGSTTKIDTKLEKVVVNFGYDATTQQIILNLVDGTTQYIDLSALITQYEFVDSDTISWEVTTDGKVKAKILDGSITENMLQPNYLAEIKVESAKAETNAIKSQSYAVGGTSSRQNEDIDNARYYYEQAKSISESFSGALVPMGTVAFEDLPSLEDAVAGWMYNISNEFVTTDEFKEGAGHTIPLGANIFKTVDNFWDLLSGVSPDLIVDSVEGNNPTIDNSTDGNLIYLKNSGYTKQDGTPTPSTPIRVDGLGIMNKWHEKSSTNLMNEYFIPCESLATVKITYNGILKDTEQFLLYFYNGSYNSIHTVSFAYGQTVRTVTAPEGTAFAKLSCNTTRKPSEMGYVTLEINGKEVLDWIEVKTCGKNLFAFGKTAIDKTSEYRSEVTQRLIISSVDGNPNDIKCGYNDGNYSMGYIVLDGIDGTKNYKFSYEIIENTTSYTPYITKDESRSTETQLVIVVNGENKDNAVSTDNYFVMTNIQVEEGTVATDYEPYQETVAYIPVSSPLYDGDYIEVFADGSGQIVRAMGSAVYDGSESGWNKGGSANGLFYILKPTNSKTSQTSLFCSHYVKSTSGTTYTTDKTTNINISNYWIIDSRFSTVDEWKTWLQSNPVTVVYELETPTTEPLTAEQVAEFKQLQTFKGVTNVIADGEVTVRYYCNNDSGETVSMLHEMVEDIPNAYAKKGELTGFKYLGSYDLGSYGYITKDITFTENPQFDGYNRYMFVFKGEQSYYLQLGSADVELINMITTLNAKMLIKHIPPKLEFIDNKSIYSYFTATVGVAVRDYGFSIVVQDYSSGTDNTPDTLSVDIYGAID